MSTVHKDAEPYLYNYQYDQLNRLLSMDVFSGLNSSTNQWSSLANTGGNLERYRYDANGNLLTLRRDGAPGQTEMDRLKYHYIAGTNRLDHVEDTVTNSPYSEDIRTQSVENYEYDAIGNLVKDDGAGITNIEWSLYGKIRRIEKGSGVISYTYDAGGNRISKTADGITTWYVRDAQGNTLSTYRLDGSSIYVGEQYLYGSSRLGAINRNLALSGSLTIGGSTVPGIGEVHDAELLRGTHQYELTNHLGNVLATVTDRKTPHVTGSTIDYYEADVVSVQDYTPFGMLMVGRTGYQTQGGWASGSGTVNGNTLPKDLSVGRRSGNQPSEYVALNSIGFEAGFESGAGDVFTAYLADEDMKAAVEVEVVEEKVGELLMVRVCIVMGLTDRKNPTK